MKFLYFILKKISVFNRIKTKKKVKLFTSTKNLKKITQYTKDNKTH